MHFVKFYKFVKKKSVNCLICTKSKYNISYETQNER